MSDNKIPQIASKTQTAIIAALSAFIGGIVAITALLLFGGYPELVKHTEGVKIFDFFYEWQSLIGSGLGSFVAIALFMEQRRRDRIRERDQHTFASVHELRKIVRKIKRNAPWRPIVEAQMRLLFTTDAKTAFAVLQKQLPEQIHSLREFHHELIDSLDAIPRNTDQNHELVLKIDNVTDAISVSIRDIDTLEKKLLTREPEDAEGLVGELKFKLNRINQTWQKIEALYEALYKEVEALYLNLREPNG